MIRRVRELRGLVDEIAEVDWGDPAWWAVIGGAALVETLARPGAAPYLVSDAEPHADTYMGWPAPAPRTLAAAIADAVADAAAASRAIRALDGTLPDQPLAVAIAAGAAARTTPADPTRARFVIGDRRHTARVSGGPDELVALARELAAGGAGLDATPAPIAAVVGDHDPAIARHVHRAAWTADGGPWLGVGRSGALAVASTCHFVIDGYGHALLAARIDAARDAGLRAALTRAAAELVGDAPVPAPPPVTRPEPLGVAWRRVDAPLPRFAVLAHALGRVLHADAGDPAARFSPVIQVPVARGAKDDPLRWRRRVAYAVTSVRFADGEPEPVDAYARRLGAAIAREVDGAGLLSRLIAATAAIPVPLAIKRRRIVGARSPRFAAPLEVLAGRAALSLIRRQPSDPPFPPLVAISAPGRVLPPDDPTATSVLTILADDAGATVSLAGTGAAGTHAGADALLDRWLRTFAASGSAAARASRSGPSS